MKIKKTFLPGFIFLLLGALLLCFFFFLYNQIKSLNESSDLVTHTNVVKLKLSEAVISLKDVETSQREYLLTHDSIFLSSYKNAYNHFIETLDEIDSLAKDNAVQQINILAIKVFSKTRLMDLDQVNNLPAQSEKLPGANLTPYLLSGKMKVDNIRDQINVMVHVEDSLLNKRVEMKKRNTFITPLYALIFFSFTLLILIISFLKINKNYHAQRKLKDEILASKIFLQSLLDSSGELIIAYDKNLRFTAINRSTEENYNIRREAVLGKHAYEIFPSLEGTGDAVLMKSVLSGRQVLNHVMQSQVEGHFFEVNMVPLNSPSGKTDGILLIGRDLTALINVTRQLKEKNEELERNNQELSSFSYVASHDLQEPLRKIQSFSNRILEKEGGLFSETTNDYFKRIISAASRMQDLITALLNLSRTNSSELVFESVDLNFILEEVKASLKDTIEERNAIIESSSLPTLKVVPQQFSQLILNLISNALKYSKVEVPPHIKISADRVRSSDIIPRKDYPFKSYWKIGIEDNGIGFEQQYEHKIFELFQRLHGKLEYGGTGIGLAICKKIVQNHNGIITATGKPGVGSIFTIYIPDSIA